MLEVDSSAAFVISENIVLKALPEFDLYYAFDIRTGDHFSLNSTAHWVLERMGRSWAFGSLLRDFEIEFELNREEALKDLCELVNVALENKNIVRRREEQAYEEKKNV